MSPLTHRFGLELELTSPETQGSNHKRAIETAVRRKDGVIYAEFSKEQPDIIIVEFDPLTTTPDEIYKKTKRRNTRIIRKVFL